MNFCIFVLIRSYITWASSSRPYSAIRYVGAAFGGPQKKTKKQRTAKGGVPYRSLLLKTYEGAHCAPLQLFILIHCVFFAFYVFIVERRGRRSKQMYHAIINIFSDGERKQINVNVQGKRACKRLVIGVKLPSACRRATLNSSLCKK